jgi:hypothetical protein
MATWPQTESKNMEWFTRIGQNDCFSIQVILFQHLTGQNDFKIQNEVRD